MIYNLFLDQISQQVSGFIEADITAFGVTYHITTSLHLADFFNLRIDKDNFISDKPIPKDVIDHIFQDIHDEIDIVYKYCGDENIYDKDAALKTYEQTHEGLTWAHHCAVQGVYEVAPGFHVRGIKKLSLKDVCTEPLCYPHHAELNAATYVSDLPDSDIRTMFEHPAFNMDAFIRGLYYMDQIEFYAELMTPQTFERFMSEGSAWLHVITSQKPDERLLNFFINHATDEGINRFKKADNESAYTLFEHYTVNAQIPLPSKIHSEQSTQEYQLIF